MTVYPGTHENLQLWPDGSEPFVSEHVCHSPCSGSANGHGTTRGAHPSVNMHAPSRVMTSDSALRILTKLSNVHARAG